MRLSLLRLLVPALCYLAPLQANATKEPMAMETVGYRLESLVKEQLAARGLTPISKITFAKQGIFANPTGDKWYPFQEPFEVQTDKGLVRGIVPGTIRLGGVFESREVNGLDLFAKRVTVFAPPQEKPVVTPLPSVKHWQGIYARIVEQVKAMVRAEGGQLTGEVKSTGSRRDVEKGRWNRVIVEGYLVPTTSGNYLVQTVVRAKEGGVFSKNFQDIVFEGSLHREVAPIHTSTPMNALGREAIVTKPLNLGVKRNYKFPTTTTTTKFDRTGPIFGGRK